MKKRGDEENFLKKFKIIRRPAIAARARGRKRELLRKNRRCRSCLFQIVKISQIGDPYVRSVHFKLRLLLLAADGGGNGSFQLTADAFCAEQADFFQGVHGELVILIGAEGGGIDLHIGA